MAYTIFISALISFVIAYFITPHFIKFLAAAGIVGLDLNKKVKYKLPASGGIVVAFGMLAGILSFVGIQTFVYGLHTSAIQLLAVTSSILIVTFGGLLDDINVKSRRVATKDGKNIKVGFPQWVKPLLTLPAAIPLMVISAGDTSMAVPFIGIVNFGLLYTFVFIPVGVVGASNMVNMIGGFNGSEAGMGLMYMGALGIFALMTNNISAIIFIATAASLLAFLKFNWIPAKILPGDSLTYLLGATFASGVIIGNMETIGVILAIPFLIEFFLKARMKFKATSLGKLASDGKLDPPYGSKIYSLTHLIMNSGRFTEKQISLILIGIEAIFGMLVFLYASSI